LNFQQLSYHVWEKPLDFQRLPKFHSAKFQYRKSMLNNKWSLSVTNKIGILNSIMLLKTSLLVRMLPIYVHRK
jgi:hypothetical protein